MLKIILLICSFVLPSLADEAKHNSFLDIGGVELPKIGLIQQTSDTPAQDFKKSLVIPTIPDHESPSPTNVIPSLGDNKPAAPASLSIKPDSSKIDNSKSQSSSAISGAPKDKGQSEAKPSAPVDSQAASKPLVKTPLPEAPSIKPEPQVTTASKPEIQTAPVVKPAAPALPPPGPRIKVPLPIPTLPLPGPKTNIPDSKPVQVQTAQQEPSVKPGAPNVVTLPPAPSASNIHEVARVQAEAPNISQRVQKPDTSSVRPVKTPIPKPPGWTFKEKIKSYSIVKKYPPKPPKQLPHTLELKQLQTAKAKKPAWSFKKMWSFKKSKSQQADASDYQPEKQFEAKTIWSFKKKKDVQTSQHASNDPSKKSNWSFKKIWSFKKKGEAPNLEPIDLIPVQPVIQQAKVPEKDTKKPTYVIKPKKIQLASNTKAYSIKEKDHDIKEKQALDFEEQELKIIKTKDYDDSLDRLRYNEYVKLFWSKFSTKREKERAADIKGYLENYYKYHLDKKQKHRN